jgi:drug/metabolite transporter (DMT)-like permease
MSFLFIRVAVPEFGTFALMELRMALAAAVLVPLVLARRQLREVIAHWRGIVLMGVLHYAVPFCLYAYAMLTLSAGYSSIINASAPLFAGVVARAWLGERLDAGRAVGLTLGFAGVALLVWDKLAAAGGQDGLAVAATVLAAFCYGFAAVMAKRKLSGVSPMAVAGGSMSAAAICLLPLSAWFWPASVPSAEAWGMVSVLGLVCTALAFVLYFRLIASAGPSKAITVTYLIPLFAVAFGAVLLGEEVTALMLAGGIVIALGTALATGLVELRSLWRRTQAFATRVAVVAIAVAALDDTPPDAHAVEPGWEVAGHWLQARIDGEDVPALVAELRRAVGETHALGIEYTAFGNDVSHGALRVGYDHKVSNGVVMKILLGSNFDYDAHHEARVELRFPFR